jgi:TPP-dependent indolepyruvate ferredoxin oxidoreductase alpha subunit
LEKERPLKGDENAGWSSSQEQDLYYIVSESLVPLQSPFSFQLVRKTGKGTKRSPKKVKIW